VAYTFTINSLSHSSARALRNHDTSRNNWLLALLTLGEGWHNNHHHFMASARQGFFCGDDITYYTLKICLGWDCLGSPQSPTHLLTQQTIAPSVSLLNFRDDSNVCPVFMCAEHVR